MPFIFQGKNNEEIAAKRQASRETFSKGLLYCLYRVAEELGYADTRIPATDTQKKNVIVDMLKSNVIVDPYFADWYGENPTFDSFANYIYGRCEAMTDEHGRGNPFDVIGIRYGRRTEAIKVIIPRFNNETGVPDPNEFHAFAYMPVRGFKKGKKDPHNYDSVPVYNVPEVPEGESASNAKEYELGAIKRDAFLYFRRSLVDVSNELGRAGQIIKNDSREFQELSSAFDTFLERLYQLEQKKSYSIATLRNLLNYPINKNKNLMDYFNSYIEAKGRGSGDLSSKQVSRLNACGRMLALYEKVQDIAWQEENYYPVDDKIVELSRKIESTKSNLRRSKKTLERLNDGTAKFFGKAPEDPKAEKAATEKRIEESEKKLSEYGTKLTEKQNELESLQKQNPDHRMRCGFLNSDKYKDAIAGKLLTARLQQMDPKVMKKALTDKAIYADLFAKIKESPEFRNNTADMTNGELSDLSEKSPSDILKRFAPKKINAVLDDDAFLGSLDNAGKNLNDNAGKTDLYSVTGFLLNRSASLLTELKAADSTFHSSSHKKFEESLKNLHERLLVLGSKQLNNLSFDDLKDAMSDVAFAAQTYQYLHQGKTLADGKLNQNIIDRMAVASEIGIIYDFVSSPDNPSKTFKEFMTELCAFKAAKSTMNEWISTGNTEKANTFAADLTDHKTFKAKEVKAVRENSGFKNEIAKKNKVSELVKSFKEDTLTLPNMSLEKKASAPVV